MILLLLLLLIFTRYIVGHLEQTEEYYINQIHSTISL